MVSPEDFIIRRQCTPFCEKTCRYAGFHHPILVAVINCVNDRGFSEFKKTVSKYIGKGWKKNDPIQDPDPEFHYPLVHWAAVLGNVTALRWCVEQGLDLNKRWGQRSETALHRLMVCGYGALQENSHNILKTFKKLVKLLRVLLKSKDDNKDLPLHVAAKVLVERPLMNDSRFDGIYTEMLKILVQKTCELDITLLNHRNIEGNTVMHIMAQHDKACEVLELLIESGADCDLINTEGLKPVDIAKSRDATDAIRVLSKDEETVGEMDVEEIGDIDIIYIESDDDLDYKNNNGNDVKDEAYIQNLLQRVKKESEDTNDPDWSSDVSADLDASTSNETLYTLDEESYDIGEGPFNILDDQEKLAVRKRWNGSPVFDEYENSSSTSSDMRKSGTSSSLNRKSSQVSENRERVSKQHCERETSTSSKTTSLNVIANQSTVPQGNGAKRKLSDKTSVSEPDVKKTKSPTSQSKLTAVSPHLVIKLNKASFKSLKSKSVMRQILAHKAPAGSSSEKTGSSSTKACLTAEKSGLTTEKTGSTASATWKTGSAVGKTDSTTLESSGTPRYSSQESSKEMLTEPEHLHGNESRKAKKTKVSVATWSKSNQENALSETFQEESELLHPKVSHSILPRMCTDVENPGITLKCQSRPQMKEPVKSVADFTTTKFGKSHSPPDMTTGVPDKELTQPERPSSFEDEHVPQTPEHSQQSFSSFAEMWSAFQRLHEKNTSSTNGNYLRKLRDLFDVFKPKPVEAPTEKQVEQRSTDGSSTSFQPIEGRPLPTSDPVNCATSSLSPTEQRQVEAVVSNELVASGSASPEIPERPFGRSTPTPEQLHRSPERSTPSPALAEQHRPKKRLEDVVTNLKERQQGRSSRKSSSGSIESIAEVQLSLQGGHNSIPSAESSSCREQPIPPSQQNVTVTATEKEPSKSVQASKNNTPQAETSVTEQVCATHVVIKKEKVREDTSKTSNMLCTRQEEPLNAVSGGKEAVTDNHVSVPSVKVKEEVQVKESTCSSTITIASSVNGQLNDEHTNNIVTKRVNKRPRMLRNALPTQIQAGSYQAMVPISTETSTDPIVEQLEHANTSTDKSNNTRIEYQPLSSVVEKLSKRVSMPISSEIRNGGGENLDPNHNHIGIIDEICEEVYGISPGPQKNKVAQEKTVEDTQGAAATQTTQTSETQTAQAKEDEQSDTTPGQRVVSTQIQVELAVPQLNQVQSSMRKQTATTNQVVAAEKQLLLPQGHTSSQTQPNQIPQLRGFVQQLSNQVQGAYGAVRASNSVIGQEAVRLQVPNTVGLAQVPRQGIQNLAQILVHQLGQGTPQGHVQRPVQQGHHYSELQNLIKNGNRIINPQSVGGVPKPQNMTQVANMLRPLIPGVSSATNQAVVQNTGTLSHLVQLYLPQGTRQSVPCITPGVQGRTGNPTVTSQANDRSSLIASLRNPLVAHVGNTLARSNNPNMLSRTPAPRPNQEQSRNVTVPSFPPFGMSNSQVRHMTIAQVQQQYQGRTKPNSHVLVQQPGVAPVRNTNPRASHTFGQQVHVPLQVMTKTGQQPRHPSHARLAPRTFGPDMATAMANQISKCPTERTAASSSGTVAAVVSTAVPGSQPAGVKIGDTSKDVVARKGRILGSSSPTPSLKEPSPQPRAVPAQRSVQATGEQSVQATNDESVQTINDERVQTTNEESEDEGLGLSGFSEADNMKDMFKDLAGTKKMLENLLTIVPKEDILQLLEKVKIDRKEQIDKWTNEYEAAAQCESHKYMEFEKLREKIDREQENARKLCDNIVKWKKQAEAIRKEKHDAASKKKLYQDKIAEENEKIPMINECINMFSTRSDDEHCGQ